jgi:hypothetical protein
VGQENANNAALAASETPASFSALNWFNEHLNPAYAALVGYNNEIQAVEGGCGFWQSAWIGLSQGGPGLVGTGLFAGGGFADGILIDATDETAGNLAYHYTYSQFVASIEQTGLRADTFATLDGDLSPLQAQLDLALPPNLGSPDAVIQIDLAGLREAGYEIPATTRVSNVVTAGDGRVYSMPGGGYEMKFSYPIPPQFIKVVTP